MLDCMAVSMSTYPVGVRRDGRLAAAAGTGRMVEVPSIVPTSDGWVTTNSATQFQDFLLMIGRSDWLDDADLSVATKRFAARRVPGRGARAHDRAVVG